MIKESAHDKSKGGQVVAVFGEVLADIFPEQKVLGGAPFNVARHLQSFELHPVMISRTGKDALREDILREMKRLDMDVSGIQCDRIFPSGQVRVHMEDGGHRFEILPDQAYDHIHYGVTHMVTMSLKPDLLYFGTLAQRAMASRQALKQCIADCNCLKFLDINLRSPWYSDYIIGNSLFNADVVKMNDEELKIVCDLFSIGGSAPEVRAQGLMQKFDLSKLIVTCGANGAWLLDDKQQLLNANPVKMSGDLVDTVGAGDAFAAVFIIGLLNDWPLDLTLCRANAFASAICGIRGAVPTHRDFYVPFIREWTE